MKYIMRTCKWKVAMMNVLGPVCSSYSSFSWMHGGYWRRATHSWIQGW